MDIRKSSRSPRLIVADRTPLPAALVASRLKIVLWLFWNFERAPPLSEWTKLLHWVIDINRLHCIVRYLWWCRSIWEETRWIWNAMCICSDFGFLSEICLLTETSLGVKVCRNVHIFGCSICTYMCTHCICALCTSMHLCTQCIHLCNEYIPVTNHAAYH